MNILEYICNLLQETNLDAFYVIKPMGYPADDYLTFNFTINDTWYSDNTNEMIKYKITINHMTKNQSNIYPVETQLRNIIKKDMYSYGLVNQGSMYIKDTQEYFTALTFYMLVPTEIETVEEPEEPTE